MEPNVEIFVPSRQYARVGWAALAGSLVCVLCGFGAPLAFIPALLCAITAAGIFWLASRPAVRLGETQLNIGDRAIAWREVREVNRSRFNATGFVSPLVVRLKLTNARHRFLIYAGEPERAERLLKLIRKNSQMASFDGVSYRDYWSWVETGTDEEADTRPQHARISAPPPPTAGPPVRLFSREDEDEIERLYQKLKTVGRLDGKDSNNAGKD